MLLAALQFYSYGVPVLMGLCLPGVMVNLLILVAVVSRPTLSTTTGNYLTLVTSLVAADATNSALLLAGLLAGSYLPVVWDIQPAGCLMLGEVPANFSIMQRKRTFSRDSVTER